MTPPAKKRLQIIDDERELCEVVGARFSKAGYEVLLSYEGQSGLEQTLREEPVCVLLDIRIRQGMDGLSYLRKLRSYRCEDPERQRRIRNIPVVVVTAAGDAMRSLFEQEGIQGYFEKPYDPDRLQHRVRDLVK